MKSMKSLRLIMMLAVIFVATATGGCIRSFEDESQLRLSNVDVSAENVRSSFVDLNVTSTIENNGAKSPDNVSIVLKAYNTRTGFLVFETERELGNIEGGSYVDSSMIVTLPKRDGYDFRIWIFENGAESSGRAFSVKNLDLLPADVSEIGIEIQEMDFLVRKAEGSAVKIQTDIYLTNEGLSTSENYRMLIKAREMDTHLIADKIWTSTGSFAPDATVIRSVNLTVPDNYNYVVEVLLWDGDTIIKRGEDYVQLNPMIEIDKDTELKTRYVDTEDFIVDEPVEEMDYNEKPETDMATPGFSGLLAVCSLLIAIAIIRRNQDE